MQTPISHEEAARALQAIELSRTAMRSAVRAHRGHAYLWLWGVIWTAMGLLAQTQGLVGIRWFPWLSLGGVIVSVLIGMRQSATIRLPIDRRFIGVLSASLVFGLGWILVLGGPASAKHMFAYIGLVVAQAYVIAGLWFDTYLLWLGLAVAVAILLGLFVFPAVFWIWIAVFGGGTLIASGFYVRYFMR